MRYEETIYISKAVDRHMKRYLGKNATKEDENFNEDDIYIETAKFKNGMEMDIKMCGVQFEKNGTSNMPWTEAVLFKNNCEVGCTDVEDRFVGDWKLEYKGNTYVTHVKVKE